MATTPNTTPCVQSESTLAAAYGANGPRGHAGLLGPSAKTSGTKMGTSGLARDLQIPLPVQAQVAVVI
jgi:hypothetical protein